MKENLPVTLFGGKTLFSLAFLLAKIAICPHTDAKEPANCGSQLPSKNFTLWEVEHRSLRKKSAV